MNSPSEHRRVQILPIWFEGAADIDHTLSTNDLQRLSRQVSENLSSALQQRLLSARYEVVGPVGLFSSQEDAWPLGAETRGQLEAVRRDVCENLLHRYPSPAGGPLRFSTNSSLGFFRYMTLSNSKRARLEQNPFHYQMTPSLTNVLVVLGATNTQAVLLVDTKAFFESKHHHTERVTWNCTGGVAVLVVEVGVLVTVAMLSQGHSGPAALGVDPFWHSSNSLQHTFTLVDAHTGQVLWLNRRSFPCKDPCDQDVLAKTLALTLGDLPKQPPR